MAEMTQEEYQKLIEAKVKGEVLVNALFDSAEKGYTKGTLRFMDLEDLLKALFPDRYNAKLEEFSHETDAV